MQKLFSILIKGIYKNCIITKQNKSTSHNLLQIVPLIHCITVVRYILSKLRTQHHCYMHLIVFKYQYLGIILPPTVCLTHVLPVEHTMQDLCRLSVCLVEILWIAHGFASVCSMAQLFTVQLFKVQSKDIYYYIPTNGSF